MPAEGFLELQHEGHRLFAEELRVNLAIEIGVTERRDVGERCLLHLIREVIARDT